MGALRGIAPLLGHIPPHTLRGLRGMLSTHLGAHPLLCRGGTQGDVPTDTAKQWCLNCWHLPLCTQGMPSGIMAGISQLVTQALLYFTSLHAPPVM